MLQAAAQLSQLTLSAFWILLFLLCTCAPQCNNVLLYSVLLYMYIIIYFCASLLETGLHRLGQTGRGNAQEFHIKDSRIFHVLFGGGYQSVKR